jgi:uncharacterized membrane protein YkvA (DUF1232 family)
MGIFVVVDERKNEQGRKFDYWRRLTHIPTSSSSEYFYYQAETTGATRKKEKTALPLKLVYFLPPNDVPGKRKRKPNSLWVGT